MDTWHRVEAPDGRPLFDRLRFARGIATRTKGLLGRRSLPVGEGLCDHVGVGFGFEGTARLQREAARKTTSPDSP